MSSWPARVAVLAGAAVLLVGAGRWERQREIDAQVRGMKHVEALVGKLDGPTLSGYRIQKGFYCLTYRRGTNVFALELCTDKEGRVVEAIDRRTDDRHIWSLRFAPVSSTAHLDPAELRRLLKRMVRSS